MNHKEERKESKHRIKTIEIEEYYTQEAGEVWWHYKYQGGEWQKYLTPYKEIPYIEYPPKIDAEFI